MSIKTVEKVAWVLGSLREAHLNNYTECIVYCDPASCAADASHLSAMLQP